MPGGKIDILVEPDLAGFPGKLQSGLQSSTGIASTIGKGLGLALGVGLVGAGAAFKEIISITADYQASLNTLQAVTGATGDQMAAAGAKAKELGSDITLPGTSAAGAAEAMTELAKGGLSVEQSMAAAKGTLILAAAAQVDGARAAQIQSDALNIFGLSAEKAGHVADVLANSANSSAVEITDVAESMKFVGPVAKAMGISMEDTATAVALLGNAGIRGSEAGTGLRGMLASLVAPSGAAKKAINLLGLETRDSSGHFVGFESIIDQLRGAQGKLTEAQFQGAVTTAFGRETMSSVLALVNSAPGSWDKMAAAVTREGGAQEVAAAKTKGLGGALEGFQSQLETTAITIGQALSPALETFVRGATGTLGFVTDLAGGVGNLTDRFPGLNSVLDTGKGLWSDFVTILGNAKDAAQPVIDGIEHLAESAGSGDGALSALSDGLGLVGDAAAGASQILGPVGDVIGGILNIAADLPGPVQAAALAFLAFQTVPGILANLRGGADDAAGSTGKLRAAIDGVTAPVTSAAGGIRQFYGEMRVQQQLAEASGEAVSKLGAVSAAFETSTVGAVAAVRSFRDDVRTLQAAAEGAGTPISGLSATVGALAQRSPAIAAMRDAFVVTSTAVSDFGDKAAAAGAQATQAFGTGLVNTVSAVPAAFGTAKTAVTDFASTVSTGVGVAFLDVQDKYNAFKTAISSGDAYAGAKASVRDFASTVTTGVGVAALDAKGKWDGFRTAISSGDAFASAKNSVRDFASTVTTGLGVAVIDAGDKVRQIPTVVGDAFRAIPGAVDTGISAIGRFSGAVAGAGASIGTGLLRGAGSLVSFLGGPWGLALVAAGAALSVLGQHQEEAKKKAQEHQAALDALAGTLDKYSGAVTQATINEKASQLSKDGTIEKVKQLGINTNDYVRATLGEGDALERVRGQLETHTRGLIENSNAYKNGQLELKNLGLSLDDLTAAAQGNQPAIDKVYDSIKRIPDLDAQTSVKMLVDGMIEAGAASGDLAAQLGISNGELDKIQQQTKDASEASRDFGSQLTFLKQGFASLGTAAPQTEVMKNGLQGLATSAGQAATAAGQAAQAIGGVAAGGQAAASSMQQSRDAFIAAATGAGLTADQARILADQIGLIPAAAATTFTSNATGVTAEMITLGAQVAAVPGAKQIVVQTLSAEATTQLRDLGFEVKNLPNGQVQVDVHDEAGRARLEQFVAFGNGQITVIKIDGDPNPATGKITATVQLGNGQTATMTYDARPDPATGKINATVDLGNGKTATMTLDALPDPATGKINGVVNYGNGKTTTVTVEARDNASAKIDNIARNRTAVITVVTEGAASPRLVRGTQSPNLAAKGAIFSAMHDGGLLGMAKGGRVGVKLKPMSGGVAQVVPPNTWRVIGDRITDDEAFIPINRSRRSQQIFEETARRMGYTVARRFAEGGVAGGSFRDTLGSVIRARVATSGASPDVVAAIGNLQRAVDSLQTRAQQQSLIVNMVANNPVAERGSDTAARKLRTTAGLLGLI